MCDARPTPLPARLRHAAVALLLGLLAAGSAGAQPHPRAAAPPGEPARPERPEPSLPPAVSTQHSLELPGDGAARTLRFTATAGSLALRDDDRAPLADIGYLAYRLEAPPGAARPVAFVFNGGPGSASAWLQLGGLGPWRLEMDGAGPSSPPVLQANAQTWLDFTDLVFLDPPGTGFSRVRASGEAAKKLWSVEGDVAALADAIRLWLRQNDRTASPKYIVGESYGGLRGPMLVRALSRQGIGVSGLVLVSPALDMGDFGPAAEPLVAAGLLPSLAAIAKAGHGPVAAGDLAEVEAYAAGGYVTDLLRGDGDAAAVARRSTEVARFTGLDPAVVQRRYGRLSRSAFDQARGGEAVGSPYDGTLMALSPDPSQPWLSAADPIADGLAAPVISTMLELYRRLGWQPQMRYVLANNQAARQWDYGRHGMPQSMTALRQILANDPRLRVLVAHGLFDTVTPYFRTKLLLAQLPPGLAQQRLRLVLLPGGHMMYLRAGPRAALRAAAAEVFAP